jgi:hypothetical protein
MPSFFSNRSSFVAGATAIPSACLQRQPVGHRPRPPEGRRAVAKRGTLVEPRSLLQVGSQLASAGLDDAKLTERNKKTSVLVRTGFSISTA